MTLPGMSQINPVDKSEPGSDLCITFSPPVYVLVTLPAAIGSHLIYVALVFYSKSDVFSQDESNNYS